MSTFLIFIAVIVGFSFIKFFADSSKESDKVVKEGGMMVKYGKLISHYLNQPLGLRVVKQTSNYVCLGTQNASGSIVFHFQHTFSSINITFEMKNILVGNHKLDWDFHEAMPQDDMIKHIDNRIEQYLNNVATSFK